MANRSFPRSYVVAGGLRATFLVDYLHTVILFIILYFFLFKIYGSSEAIGSPGKLWDLLQTAAKLSPVAGNAAGSYTTMKSNSGILFAGCTMATGFSGVFCDQGYCKLTFSELRIQFLGFRALH